MRRACAIAGGPNNCREGRSAELLFVGLIEIGRRRRPRGAHDLQHAGEVAIQITIGMIYSFSYPISCCLNLQTAERVPTLAQTLFHA